MRHALEALAREGKVDEIIAMVIGLLADVSDQNTSLRLKLANALRQLYGRRSEKVDPAQLQLMLGELSSDQQALAHAPAAPLDQVHSEEKGDVPAPETKTKTRTHPGRKPLPESLPRERVVHEPPASDKVCDECGADKKLFGHETSEMIEFVPATFRVIEHARAKYACSRCQSGVVIGPVGDRIIESGLPGPGLLAHVLTSKFADHLPIHRLAKMYARSGVDLPDSTLYDWAAAAADALEPIVRKITEQVISSVVLGTDATGMRVLDRDDPKGIKRGTMWAYVGDREVVFEYTPTGEAEGPASFLQKRVGPVQCDAASVFNDSVDTERITRIGCWTHCRRKFVEAMDAGDANAAVAVSLIRQMYDIERIATEQGVDAEERQRRRDVQTRPLVHRLGKWAAEMYNRTPPKTSLGRALGYTIRQWDTLTVFLDDGFVPIDNNRVERALRGLCVGRKNYLFCGSDDGARRAAIAYSVIGTCALRGVEPLAYLRDVFTKLAAGWPNARLDELLPGAAIQDQANQTDRCAPSTRAC